MPRSKAGWPVPSREDILDHSTPKPLTRYLPRYECRTARQMRWEKLHNGELLKTSEETGFDTMVTCDRNLRYQQNLKRRKLAIVEITTNNWPLIESHVDQVIAAVDAATPGSYTVVEIRLRPKPSLNVLAFKPPDPQS